MALYFFHTKDGHEEIDAEGTDLPTLSNARVEAAKVMGDLLRRRSGDLWVDGDWNLTVTDSEGLVLLCIDVAATEAPAAHVITPSPRKDES